jgi:hypothetical protein
MRILCTLGVALAIASSSFAAPNVTNVTQKGSLLIFPDIRIDSWDETWDTLVRIQNDGSSDVDVICYWMDGNKNRVDFILPVTKNQPVWFDARTGNGTFQVNPFPQSAANGFDNPFLIGPPFPPTTEATDTSGPYLRGMLACWAVDGGAQNQVKWNHLSGTATVHSPADGAYEYNAYAFFVPTGLDLEPVGIPGALNLNGVEYDSCPLYQIAQFSPNNDENGVLRVPGQFVVGMNRWAIVGCTLNLQQDWVPVWTKLQFDIWNEDEVKFTGAFECADSWHEVVLDEADDNPPIIDSAAQNFDRATLGTYAARMRIQGVKSAQCEAPGRITQAVGILAVHSAEVEPVPDQETDMIGTTLAAAGKFTGKIVWDPEGVVPEGGIR